MEIVNSSLLVSVGQFITEKTNYITCEGHSSTWLLSTKASFYKLSNEDERKYAIATSAATNIFFQYKISLQQISL